ncbi:Uncharacterised protein [Candidatus Gugararchaeum adminiculabundum]|nr:Uncharacterised protein [Candidatus Gugararchaeum adminiculabundum]
MKIVLDPSKDVNANAAEYYDRAKKMKGKIEGARIAVEESKKELRELEKKGAEEKKEKAEKKTMKVKRELEWYEKFHWFKTSRGLLVIAGKDASQNDLIYSRYLEENDLFFHADIQGAPATVLKNGVKEGEGGANAQDKKETAQFAASYSKAWKARVPAVDVYAVKKNQLTKHAQGGFIGKGAFGIIGEREWFKTTPLGIAIGVREGIAYAEPVLKKHEFEKKVELVAGSKGKAEMGKMIAKTLGVHVDEVMALIPSGDSSLKK